MLDIFWWSLPVHQNKRNLLQCQFPSPSLEVSGTICLVWNQEIIFISHIMSGKLVHTGLHDLQLCFPICLFYIKWTLPVLHSPALALLSFHALLQAPHPETTQILRSQLDDPITGPYPAPEFCYHLTSQTSLPLSHLLSGYFPVCLYVPPSLTFSLLNSSMTASPDWVSWLSGFCSWYHFLIHLGLKAQYHPWFLSLFHLTSNQTLSC